MLDPGEGPLDGLRIADVALEQIDLAGQVGRHAGVGQQRVEDTHLAAFGDQRVDDVRADESGAAGDEDHLAPAAARTRVMSRRARSVPRRVPVTFERPCSRR